MVSFWRMYCFHLRQYFRNSYFLCLLVISSLSLLMYKYLSAYSQGQPISSQDVMISSIFGMWSAAVTAAGILHFQRSQGVLVYLVNSPSSSLLNLMALVSAPASFGLLAYPLTYVAAGLLNNFYFVEIEMISFIYILLFWISALSITYFIAEIFLLTRNAFVYEDLFVTPLMILSGLFPISLANNSFLQFLQHLIPISFPVALLTGETHFSWLKLLTWFLILCCWFGFAYKAFRSLVYKIRIQGKVEVM
ncbi:MAG: hypothetical protein ACK5LM_07470 [Lactovum sp.]